MNRRLRILVKIARRLRRVPGPLDTPCWEWQGPTSGSGRGGNYGRMSLDGSTVSVHRTLWATLYGPIPPKKQLDHECENRRCANPRHLHLTTQRQNLRGQKRRCQPRT